MYYYSKLLVKLLYIYFWYICNTLYIMYMWKNKDPGWGIHPWFLRRPGQERTVVLRSQTEPSLRFVPRTAWWHVRPPESPGFLFGHNRPYLARRGGRAGNWRGVDRCTRHPKPHSAMQTFGAQDTCTALCRSDERFLVSCFLSVNHVSGTWWKKHILFHFIFFSTRAPPRRIYVRCCLKKR